MHERSNCKLSSFAQTLLVWTVINRVEDKGGINKTLR